MLYHFASAKRNYPQWLASHPDGYVLVVKLAFAPAKMPRNPDGSVDIEAFPERIFGSDHVVRQPGGSVEHAGAPEPPPRPAPRVLHRATCGVLQAPAEDCQMICGTREELDARLSGAEVQLLRGLLLKGGPAQPECAGCAALRSAAASPSAGRVGPPRRPRSAAGHRQWTSSARR